MENENNQKQQKKLSIKIFKKIAVIAAVVLGAYVALWGLRFAQLNYGGRSSVWVIDLPPHLLPGIAHDYPFAFDGWKTQTVCVQSVDLDGDFKKEFILYCRGGDDLNVYSVEPGGRYMGIGGFDVHGGNEVYYPGFFLRCALSAADKLLDGGAMSLCSRYTGDGSLFCERKSLYIPSGWIFGNPWVVVKQEGKYKCLKFNASIYDPIKDLFRSQDEINDIIIAREIWD